MVLSMGPLHMWHTLIVSTHSEQVAWPQGNTTSFFRSMQIGQRNCSSHSESLAASSGSADGAFGLEDVALLSAGASPNQTDISCCSLARLGWLWQGSTGRMLPGPPGKAVAGFSFG